MPVVPLQPGYVDTSSERLSRREWYRRARANGWSWLHAFFLSIRHGG